MILIEKTQIMGLEPAMLLRRRDTEIINCMNYIATGVGLPTKEPTDVNKTN